MAVVMGWAAVVPSRVGRARVVVAMGLEAADPSQEGRALGVAVRAMAVACQDRTGAETGNPQALKLKRVPIGTAAWPQWLVGRRPVYQYIPVYDETIITFLN